MTSAATRRLVASVVAAPLLIAPALAGCAPGAAPVTKVMLFGDSITQGRDGDFTWRYRLWKQLQDEGERSVDFVGPADDLYDGSWGYRDPMFDQHHAARWGTKLGDPAYAPATLGLVFRPDVVVVELGVNDLRHDSTPVEVEGVMRRTIGELRRTAPGVDVVLVHVPILTVPGAVELNGRYDALAAELDDENARVVVAAADEGFVPDPVLPGSDSYDGLHPSESGEIKIAAAVAGALAELGIGS